MGACSTFMTSEEALCLKCLFRGNKPKLIFLVVSLCVGLACEETLKNHTCTLRASGLTRMSRFFAFDLSHVSIGCWACEFPQMVLRILSTILSYYVYAIGNKFVIIISVHSFDSL